jgi:sulfur-oxidizing protein SoxA
MIMPGKHWITVLGLLLVVNAQAESPRSGYTYLKPDTRAMQDDDFANPGMVAVEQGAGLFAQPGKNGKHCASCHGNEGEDFSLSSLASYPVYSEAAQGPLTLRNRIRGCWTEKLDQPPLKYTSPEAIALETYVRSLARGQLVNVDTRGPMRSHYEAGKRIYYTRYGQVDLACNLCHDNHDGQYLRGQLLSQGQTNGFPVYRLKSGQITGLHQRMKQCFVKFRAQPFPAGSAELVDLEVFLAARGNGLKIETPAVRY